MTKLTNPVPMFYDGRGVPLMGGSIYIGLPNVDPRSKPVSVFWDNAFTKFAVQPLRTIGGLISNATVPSSAFVAEGDYSVLVLDQNGVQVFYSPSVVTAGDAFQPSDADLTAIAALSTNDYGRSLLTLANKAALQAAIGDLPGSAKLASFTSGSTASGSWVKRPDNNGRFIITQRGFATHTDNSGGQKITFPIQFTDASTIIAVASNASGGPPVAFHGTGTYLTDSMVVWGTLADNTPAGAGTTFTWIAEGQ